MTAEQFNKQIKMLGLSPNDLGRALGKTETMVRLYKRGYPIGRTVRLAIEALLSRKRNNKDLYS